MGLNITKDFVGELKTPIFVLSTRDGTLIGDVPAYNVVTNFRFNSPSEISFKVNKEDNGDKYFLWDDLSDFKLVWCKDYDMWFEISVETNDDELIKNVYGKALCESELSQVILHNIEINTEIDIEREDYKKPTVFFDEEDAENSLLNRLSEKIPHYTIRHVDSTLSKIQRTFSFDNKSVYDAFNEIAEEIGCVFIYGEGTDSIYPSPKRTISVYDLYSTCLDCGYRGDDFLPECPECASKNVMHGYGTDTGIYISSDDLGEEIVYKTNVDSVKNCFKLEAGDDVMTAAVRNCNPNGSDYIWNFSEEMKNDMSDELQTKLKAYDNKYLKLMTARMMSVKSDLKTEYNKLVTKYNAYRSDDDKYAELTTSKGLSAFMTVLYDTIDFEQFIRSELMPVIDNTETTAANQLLLLTRNNLSPVAVIGAQTISTTIADSAVLGLAKILISPLYTVSISESELNGNAWSGKFKVTANSGNDSATSTTSVTIDITDDVEKYAEQRVRKVLKNKDTEKYSITGLFSLELDDFVSEIKKYSIDCLTSFHDASQSALDILADNVTVECSCGFSGKYQTSYNFKCPKCNKKLSGAYIDLYYPYYQKFLALSDEIAVKDADIAIIKEVQDYITYIKNNIANLLSLETSLGDLLWKELCSYRREDTYNNSNYISDGLTNAEIFKRAQEFLEAASKELYKSSTLQHSISGSLKNLLAIEEFQPLTESFDVGNWLRLAVDKKVYKLRLLSCEVDYENLDKLQVEFSDVIKNVNSYSDVESILKQAASIATSYDSIAHQASKGNKSSQQVSQWVSKGLKLTNSFISDSDNQEMTLDSHGIIMKEYLPITKSYSEKQVKIINKGLYVTNDSWETAKAAIGNFIYYDPRSKQKKDGYGVIAETIVGNVILSEDVGIYTEGNNIILNKNGINITNGTNSVIINPNDTTGLFSVKNGDNKVLWFDEKGNGHFSGQISVGGNDNNNFVVDSDGNVTMSGSIKLNGEITFNGNPSSVLVLYARTELSSPTKGYSDYESTSSSNWHKSLSSNDSYASYSYDAGKTWTIAVKIKGTDGADGSDANVPDYITETKITQTTIESPNITGGTITGGTIISASNESDERIVINSDGIISKNELGELHGLVTHPQKSNYNDGFSLYSRGIKLFDVSRTLNNVNMNFYKATNGNLCGAISSAGDKMYLSGDWAFLGKGSFDFSNATVTGLSSVAKFG